MREERRGGNIGQRDCICGQLLIRNLRTNRVSYREDFIRVIHHHQARDCSSREG